MPKTLKKYTKKKINKKLNIKHKTKTKAIKSKNKTKSISINTNTNSGINSNSTKNTTNNTTKNTTKNNKKDNKKNNLNKKHKSGYEWGLGIEHEFVPVVKFNKFSEFKDIYNLVYKKPLNEKNTDIKQLEKFMSSIKNDFYLSIPVHYPYTYVNSKYPFSNIEFTADKNFFMIETKNMDYRNVSLNTILTELNKNTKTMLEDYNNTINKEYKTKFNSNKILKQGFKEANEGSCFYLYKNKIYHDSIYDSTEPIVNVNNNEDEKLHLGIDTSGSYHFWITLPHKETDNHKALHQRAAYLLQSIEPLLIGIYCSPDPRINKTNKHTLFAGSFRGAVNEYANYGTSPIQDYNDDRIQGRTMDAKNIQQPSQIDSNHYIFQIRDRYNKKTNDVYTDKIKNTVKKPDYMLLNNKYDKTNFVSKPYYYSDDKPKPMDIGLNIRRKSDIKGFEFRIMDHLPETELKNLAKVIYIIACMSYEINGKDLNLASSNNGWNTMITNTLFDGNRAPLDPGYIKFLETQLNITLDKSYHSIIELLESIVDKCWSTISKNKKNGLWLILDDDKTKPVIVSKNKEILDKLI